MAEGNKLRSSAANTRQIDRAAELFSELVDEACVRGWNGKIRIEAVVADGTIQHLIRTAERIDRTAG